MTAVRLRNLRLENLLMIKAIIFDLGRVIVPFDFGRGYASPKNAYSPTTSPSKRREQNGKESTRFSFAPRRRLKKSFGGAACSGIRSVEQAAVPQAREFPR